MQFGFSIASLEVEDKVAVELVKDSVAAVYYTAMEGLSGCRIKWSQESQTSLVQPPVFSAHPPFSYGAIFC